MTPLTLFWGKETDMTKRKLAVAALFLSTFLLEGCCVQRPYIFRRWWWGMHDGCCSSAYLGTPCCAGSGPIVEAGMPPLAHPGTMIPGGPSMPNAQPLTKTRFAQR
jgi:hypothetical protein